MDNEVQNNNPITEENKETIQTNTTVNNANTYTNSSNTESKGFSIASMVLGIISLVFCCVWWITFPCAILAIIFSVIGKKKGGKGMATTGLVLGIIAIAVYILLVILGLGAMAGLAAAADELGSIN